MQKARKHFGDEVAQQHFYLLPLKGTVRNRILQDLFIGDDLRYIKAALGLPNNSSFQKTITSLFYSPNKDLIINKISLQTKENFNNLFDNLFQGLLTH
jgi:hypothetical protein